VEDALVRAFKLATAWKAIILIDEVRIPHATFFREIHGRIAQADVFLERRSLNDLHRNAMIAVL
jgi:hypothetical protein